MLKNFVCFTLAMLAALLFCACSTAHREASENKIVFESADSSIESGRTDPEPLEAVATESQMIGGQRILIAYFTWSGNTREMAEYIAAQTGGNLLEIEPVTPYPTDYNETGELAKVERDENQRPEIANLPESLDDYDTILIGYPIWWHTAPMIIGTFLESYDLTGKEIYPFTQSASMDTEQFENSMAFVRQSASGAVVHDGLFAEESDTETIDAYLESNGLMK